MARILVAEATSAERSRLRGGPLSRESLSFAPGKLEAADPRPLKGVEVLSVFIGSRVDAGLLRRLPRLRLVATRSTGYDHVDLAACRRRGVRVANVPSYGENTVAEHTFALILALSRKVHQAYFRTTRGDFSLEGLQGFDLKGKVFGVIGTGHIGLHAARIAKGFGMSVVAHDVAPDRLAAETLGFQYLPLEQVLARADVLSLHVPYAPSTHHLIDAAALRRVKKSAILINTARGGVVDTRALALALDEGRLAGAGLDVLEGEELIKEERQVLTQELAVERLKTLLQNHILLNRENVVITPHIAFNSREAFQRIVDVTAANIRAFLDGRPENLVR